MKLFVLAGLSGILLATSYIPFYPWALFFCLVPLFSAWAQEARPLRVFLLGWFCQFIFNVIGFHWIYHTAAEFGHLPMLPSVIAVVGFASFESLDLPLAGLLVCLLKRKYTLKPIFEIALYCLSFFVVQALYPTIFPWNLGYAWYWANWPAVQWADVVGFEGLSLFTLLSQVLFWKIWQVRRDVRRVVRISVFFLGVFVPLNITGQKRALAYEKMLETEGRDTSVLMVQANIGNLEKAYAEKGLAYQDYIIDEYVNLTREGLIRFPDIDFVAFPETALPVSLNREYYDLPETQKIRKFIRETNKPFLAGAYTDSLPRTNPYNSVYLYSDQGELVDFYNKTHLLAFGEYIPFGSALPFLYDWMPFVSHFERGPGPSILRWKDYNFGIQICYEGLYPSFSRGLVNKGANVFFNATNDSWFGKDFEPQQHMIMTAARSIEFRIPLIRSTNTGISTVVTQTGRLLDMSPLHEKWLGKFTFKHLKNPQPTFYGEFYFMVFLMALILFVVCFYFGRQPRRTVVESSAP